MQSKWLKTNLQKIDLINLFFSLCKQWKQILICSLFFACLIGGYFCFGENKDNMQE